MPTNFLKTAVIGLDNTGKTLLCNAMADRKIDQDYKPTIGVDLIVKYIPQGNKLLKLYLWDIAGNEKFINIVTSYIRSTPILIFCYSAECLKSFEEMTRRYEIYSDSCYTEDKHIIFVATKIDSNNIKSDYAYWGSEYAKKYKRPFIKTSAYTKEGVQELIKECLSYIETINNNSTVEPVNLNYKIKNYRVNCC